jgi:hypothetical protein
LAAVALAACQGLPSLSLSETSAEPALPSWRVVERLGEARYLAPSMAGWEQVPAGGMIPGGSQIATGIGGRLIIQQAGNQLSAGTRSRFILPGPDAGGSVRQSTGWLRYRIATPAGTFGIDTPFLDLLVDDAVLDVTVGEGETEVAVVSGRVLVKTEDGRRQIDLGAGHTGYASLADEALAVRRGPGQPAEAVPPLVLPALHPDRAAGAKVAPDQADPAAPIATVLRRPAPATAFAAAALAPVEAAAPAAPSDAVAAAAEPRPDAPRAQTSDEPVEQVRQRFDALTEGLLDGLLPALPAALPAAQPEAQLDARPDAQPDAQPDAR